VAAPRVGGEGVAVTVGEGILGGIRVVEFADLVFLPSAGAILSDFGAEVIKIEPPGPGDMNRHYHKLGGNPVSEFPYIFYVDNRNKKSLAVDLREEAGREMVRRLIAVSDVFTTNRREAALSRYGLTCDELHEINPRLVYVHGTGYGERGPEAHRPGYDAVCYWSRSGIESQIFPLEGWLGPLPWGSGDHPSGLAAFGGIMLALYARERTGRGCKVPVSLLACGAWANSSTISAELCGAEFMPKGPREAYHYTWLHYLTADQRIVKLCIPDEPKKWQPLCRALDRVKLLEDPRFDEYEKRVAGMLDLIEIFDRAFAEHPLEYWIRRLDEFDIPHTALPDYQEIGRDRQMAANNIFVAADVPGFDAVRTVNTPIEIEGVAKRRPGAFPELGENTLELMLEVGYSEAEVAALAERGVVQVPPDRAGG
jgi:formyl-CoA transferase